MQTSDRIRNLCPQKVSQKYFTVTLKVAESRQIWHITLAILSQYCLVTLQDSAYAK